MQELSLPINWNFLDCNFAKLLDLTDFSRIVKVMVALDWTWVAWGTDKEDSIPDEDALRMMAQKLYEDGKRAIKNDPTILKDCLAMGRPFETSCGGLVVSFYPRGVVQLSFDVMGIYDCVNDSFGDHNHFTNLYDAQRVWE